MKKITLASALLCINLYALRAQDVFQRIYNTGSQSLINLDWYCSLYAIDSGYVAAGSITDPTSGATLMHVYNNGTVKSATVYNMVPGSISSTIDLVPLPDQTMMHNVYANAGSVLIKSDYTGAMLTARQLTPLFSTTVYKQITRDGYIFGAGRSRSNNVNGGMFCKLDLDGNPVSATFIQGPPDRLVTLTNIFSTADGGFVLSGTRLLYGIPAPSEMVIIKTDSVGNLLWSKQLSTAGQSTQPVDGMEAPDGSLVFIVNNAATSFTSLLKTDNNGNALWYKTYSTPGLNQKPAFYNLKNYGVNQFIAVGNMDSTAYNSRPVYMIFDDAGNVVDARRYLGISKLVSSGNYYDPARGLLMYGYKNDPADYGYFLFKTDLNFNSACSSQPVTLQSITTPTTDSVIAYTSGVLTLGVNDIGGNITQNTLTLSDYDLCPAITSVNSIDHDDLFSIAPVPASEVIMIKASEAFANCILRIEDVSGKEVRQVMLHGNKTELNIADLSPGIYFYKANNALKTITGKFIVK